MRAYPVTDERRKELVHEVSKEIHLAAQGLVAIQVRAPNLPYRLLLDQVQVMVGARGVQWTVPTSRLWGWNR